MNLFWLSILFILTTSQKVKDLYKKNGPLHRDIAHGCTHQASEWLVKFYKIFKKNQRLAFHDAGTYNKKSKDTEGGPGGPDGSAEIEIENPKHAGLTAAIMQYRSLVSWDVTFSDIVVAGAIIALKVCGGPEIEPTEGRLDTLYLNDLTPLPSEHSDQSSLSMLARDLELDVCEHVALFTGAHSIGKIHRRNSPLVFERLGITDANVKSVGMDKTPFRFDNDIFKRVLKDDTPLLSDRTLLTDPQKLDCVNKFATSQPEFFKTFKTAFEKLIKLGHTNLKVIKVAVPGRIRQPNKPAGNIKRQLSEPVGSQNDLDDDELQYPAPKTKGVCVRGIHKRKCMEAGGGGGGFFEECFEGKFQVYRVPNGYRCEPSDDQIGIRFVWLGNGNGIVSRRRKRSEEL